MEPPLWSLLEQALRATAEIQLTEKETPGVVSDRTLLLQILRNQQLSLRCYIEALEVWMIPVKPAPTTMTTIATMKKKQGK